MQSFDASLCTLDFVPSPNALHENQETIHGLSIACLDAVKTVLQYDVCISAAHWLGKVPDPHEQVLLLRLSPRCFLSKRTFLVRKWYTSTLCIEVYVSYYGNFQVGDGGAPQYIRSRASSF